MKRLQALLLTLVMLGMTVVGAATPTETVYAAEISANDMTQTSDQKQDENTDKLSYLYLESNYIETPGAQNVLVAFGGEETRIKEGTLTVQNYRTGEKRQFTSEECMDNTILFTVDYAAEDAGVYEVTDVDVLLEADSSETAETTEAENPEEVSVHLADTGMTNVYFGVDEQLTVSDETAASTGTADTQTASYGLDTESTAIDMSDVELSVVSLNGDEDGAAQIEEALNDTDSSSKARNLQTEGDVVVVLDPGHDATHGGSSGGGLNEATLNLKIALYCRAELQEYQGVTVYMTRESSGCPHPGTSSTNDNAARVDYAASVGANYYVSIHCNASKSSSSTNGAEVYYPNSNYNGSIGADGANLATQIMRQLTALGLKNNGIEVRNSGDHTTYPDGSLADYYGVIRRAKLAGITGIIVEHAYQTNASNAAFLRNEGNLQNLGIADATGIANYLGLSKVKVDREKVTAFVTRLYNKCLNRDPDTAGLNDWVDRICSGKATGADAAVGFFFSQEYLNKGVSDDIFVEDLYNVMMDRASDEGGKSNWIYRLNNGVERIGVLNGFIGSVEFTGICDSYGIKRGLLELSGRNQNTGLTPFVARLYTKALDRAYDEDGLDEWCNRINNKTWTVDDAATIGFFFSQEYLNKKATDSEYVKTLYRTFFDREYDQAGYEDWMSKLKKGTSRQDVLKGFSQSTEFSNLKKSFGL